MTTVRETLVSQMGHRRHRPPYPHLHLRLPHHHELFPVPPRPTCAQARSRRRRAQGTRDPAGLIHVLNVLAVVLRVALCGSDDSLRLRKRACTYARRLGDLVAGFGGRPPLCTWCQFGTKFVSPGALTLLRCGLFQRLNSPLDRNRLSPKPASVRLRRRWG
jgi:hypothetical protein